MSGSAPRSGSNGSGAGVGGRGRLPPASPIVSRGPASSRRTKGRRRRRVAPKPKGPIGEELDAEDEERLLNSVLKTTYEQFIRPSMPITYLGGTSMMKHDPGPDRKPHWCHPHETVKAGTPIWNRPVTPFVPLVNPAEAEDRRAAGAGAGAGGGRPATGGTAAPGIGRSASDRELLRRRAATPGSKSGPGSAPGARSRPRPGTSGGSSGHWSVRSGDLQNSGRSFGTVRNGTSLNMPSFKRLPAGHPQSILYSALFPHMPISHIKRPGSAEFSRVFQRTQKAKRTVPTSTLRAGFQPNYKQTLLPFEPQDAEVFKSTTKRAFVDRSKEFRTKHASDVETIYRTPKGDFTTYMRQALIKKVEYYKVGH